MNNTPANENTKPKLPEFITRLQVAIKGYTAHGARPHLGINSVDAACMATTALHIMPKSPFGNSSVQVLSIDAGTSSINMIPGQVAMSVEIRSCSDEELQALTARAVHALEKSVASIGATVKITPYSS